MAPLNVAPRENHNKRRGAGRNGQETGEALDNGSVDSDPRLGAATYPAIRDGPATRHTTRPQLEPCYFSLFQSWGQQVSRFAKGGENQEAGNRMKLLLPHIESVACYKPILSIHSWGAYVSSQTRQRVQALGPTATVARC